MSDNLVVKPMDNTNNQTVQTVEPVQMTETKTSGVGRYIYSVFHLIMSLVAIYLSFKCNNGFSFGSFFVAFCCPYIYIIYVLATQGTCGVLESKNN